MRVSGFLGLGFRVRVSGLRVSGLRVSGLRVSGLRISGLRISGLRADDLFLGEGGDGGVLRASNVRE